MKLASLPQHGCLLHRMSLVVALNDGDAFWWLTVAFGEQRTCAAEARGLHSTRMTHVRVRQESWQRIGGASLPRGKA